jgi:hypothetical protein
MYTSESELYPEVIRWLEKYLKGKHPKAEIKAYDTSRQDLSEFLRQHKLHSFFAEFETYVIKVDIIAAMKYKDQCDLAFVECKLNAINLKDVSQLLGYSRVVKPKYSLIISPAGISAPLNTLVKIFKRYDILEYQKGFKIKIAEWNKAAKEIDIATLLPSGEHF